MTATVPPASRGLIFAILPCGAIVVGGLSADSFACVSELPSRGLFVPGGWWIGGRRSVVRNIVLTPLPLLWLNPVCLHVRVRL